MHINFDFTQIDRIVMLQLYTQNLPELWNKNHRHVTQAVGFEPTTLAILDQCLALIN